MLLRILMLLTSWRNRWKTDSLKIFRRRSKNLIPVISLLRSRFSMWNSCVQTLHVPTTWGGIRGNASLVSWVARIILLISSGYFWWISIRFSIFKLSTCSPIVLKEDIPWINDILLCTPLIRWFTHKPWWIISLTSLCSSSWLFIRLLLRWRCT